MLKKEIRVAVNCQHCTNNKAFTFSVEIVPHNAFIDFLLKE